MTDCTRGPWYLLLKFLYSVFFLDWTCSQLAVIDPLLGQVRIRTYAFPLKNGERKREGEMEREREISPIFILSCLHFQLFWQNIKLLSQCRTPFKSSSWKKRLHKELCLTKIQSLSMEQQSYFCPVG